MNNDPKQLRLKQIFRMLGIYLNPDFVITKEWLEEQGMSKFYNLIK